HGFGYGCGGSSAAASSRATPALPGLDPGPRLAWYRPRPGRSSAASSKVSASRPDTALDAEPRLRDGSPAAPSRRTRVFSLTWTLPQRFDRGRDRDVVIVIARPAAGFCPVDDRSQDIHIGSTKLVQDPVDLLHAALPRIDHEDDVLRHHRDQR